MTKYYDELLQEINENVNLLEYAEKTLELEKRGGEYFAHCPKHTDITPSLHFTPEKNVFYCFSCGRSGGIINFLMEYENLNFDDAVEKAAKLASIDFNNVCHSQTITFLRKLKKSSQEKKEKYKHQLLNESEYLKYKIEPINEWIDEGIKQEIIDLFGIRFDDYRNRIIYPVRTINGELINIKGRTLNNNYKELKIPKYINYYPVGIMDYLQGLDITLPYVEEKGEIIIFEGIKSVMKAYGWGYKNSASAEKHTLTKEQINLLVRLKVDIVFAFDSDINYENKDVWQSIEKLKRLTNVYLVQDKYGLLGGKENKNSPVDMGIDIWEELYLNKRKVV